MTGSRLATIVLGLIVAFQISITQAQDWIYTTVEGDNLWNLSEQHLDRVTRFKQLQKLNGIENPKKIRPGTRLRIPLKWIRSNPTSAEIAALEGSAVLIRADGSEEDALKIDTSIHLGDQLRSGADSTVAIRFADNSILTLHGSSLIRFDHLSAHGDTGMVDSRLHLLEGRMDTRVTPAVGPGSRFQIQTPSAISAVRGTEYRAAVADGGKLSSIEVLHGKVAVSGAEKQTLIRAGFGTQVAEGESPIPPRKLLPPPQLTSLSDPIRTINWVLSWLPLTDARDYRIEIAAAETFDTLLWQQVSEYPRAGLPDLPDGRYFARIRGVDELGLEGENSVQELLIDARPQAPLQLKPAANQLLRGTPPELQWTASDEADHYRLEISADKDFSQLLADRSDLTGTRFDTSELAIPGTYYWRLTSITASGEHGPVGMQRGWEVKPIPEKVDPDMTAADDDGKLVASWQAGTPDQTYQVQLANDPEFQGLVIDQTLANPSFSFDPVKGQIRYLRVRAIEPDGYLGPWGAVQKVFPITDNSPLIIFGSALLALLLL